MLCRPSTIMPRPLVTHIPIANTSYRVVRSPAKMSVYVSLAAPSQCPPIICNRANIPHPKHPPKKKYRNRIASGMFIAFLLTASAELRFLNFLNLQKRFCIRSFAIVSNTCYLSPPSNSIIIDLDITDSEKQIEIIIHIFASHLVFIDTPRATFVFGIWSKHDIHLRLSLNSFYVIITKQVHFISSISSGGDFSFLQSILIFSSKERLVISGTGPKRDNIVGATPHNA